MSDIAARSVRFEYTNWRGETAERWATPSKIWWGRTDYHPEPQWLMTAFDHDKGADRDFALNDCRFLGSGAAGYEPETETQDMGDTELPSSPEAAAVGGGFDPRNP